MNIPQHESDRATTRYRTMRNTDLKINGGGNRVCQPLDVNARLLGRMGSLEVRLARSKDEIRKAQELRYQVFYQELSAKPEPHAPSTRRDKDAYDHFCDHLLVIDRKAHNHRNIIATYRIMRQVIAQQNLGFYSQTEFDISKLLECHPHYRFMEVGRSCVSLQYRSKRTLELMWHGLWAYALQHNIDVMMGCASLPGTNPRELAMPLSFLHHFASPKPEWYSEALPGKAAKFELLPRVKVNPKTALRALPPLIKGYLRLGAQFGRDAVVDPKFATTDVLVIMPVSDLNARYVSHYGADASRLAG